MRHVPDAKREYIGTSENGVDLDVAAIETAGPAFRSSVEIESVALAVNGYVVKHKNQWPVIIGR
jgi:hypothetical protein